MHKGTNALLKSYRNIGELDPHYISPTVSKKVLSHLGFIQIDLKKKKGKSNKLLIETMFCCQKGL